MRLLVRLAIVLMAGALCVGGAVLAAPAHAQAQPAGFTPFQVQTFVFADLPTPVIGTVPGPQSGQITLVAHNPTNSGATGGPLSVRWLSLATGRSGLVTFTQSGTPPPIVISPGVGPVVADIEGGLWPGFGFFVVR